MTLVQGKRWLICGMVWGLFCLATPGARAVDKPAGVAIDLAICLDISGSMEGLIESAKIKLWTIVNDFARIEPTPHLRVALLTYGCNAYDPKSGWVRKDLDLTTDLDDVYRQLNALRTNGGTELVARVSRDALQQLKWREDRDALKIIFVCGNEPADQDREVSLESVAAEAKKKGIFINAIYCGWANHPEARKWQEFALAAGGKYSNIDQNQAVKQVVIATPYDDKLLELNHALNRTYVAYGKEGRAKAENQLLQDANARRAAPAAALERAATKASGIYRNSAWDIIDRMKEDPKFDWKSLKEEELSEELRQLRPEQREAYIRAKAAERAELQKQIAELSAARAKFLAEQQRKQPPHAADKAFDEAIRAQIREQAKTRNIHIP